MNFDFNGNTPGCRLFAGERNLSQEELVQAKEEIVAAKDIIQKMQFEQSAKDAILEQLDLLYSTAESLYRSRSN